jgi:hypothetical protein
MSDGAPPGRALVCSRCGSERLRRSRPRGVIERIARGLFGVRFHRCRNCGSRGSHWHDRSSRLALQRRRRRNRPAPPPPSLAMRTPVRAGPAFTIGVLLLALAALAALSYWTASDQPPTASDSSSR